MAIVGAAAAEEDQFGIKIKDGHEHDTNGRNENEGIVKSAAKELLI